jgi:hypothetical protein
MFVSLEILVAVTSLAMAAAGWWLRSLSHEIKECVRELKRISECVLAHRVRWEEHARQHESEIELLDDRIKVIHDALDDVKKRCIQELFAVQKKGAT